MPGEDYVRIAKHAALRRKDPLLAALRDAAREPGAMAETLRAHHLVRLVNAAADAAELRAALPAAVAERLEAWRSLPLPTTAELLSDFGEVRGALDAEEVPWLLLKGFYFAERLYGGLDRRPQHDVDVLVRERHFGRALRACERLGFQRQGYDLHARTLSRGRLRLDLHRCLRRAPAFRADETAAWDSALAVTAGGSPFLTLCDEWTLVFLTLSAFEDIGQGMVKLKQLLDLYFFLRQVDAGFDWEAFFERRAAEGLERVCLNVLALCVALFEAGEEAPRLAAALAARHPRITRGSRAEALALVFAGRKEPDSLAWFAGIYPGSLAFYLAWFWYGGLPANLRDFSARRLLASLRLAAGLGRAAHGPRS